MRQRRIILATLALLAFLPLRGFADAAAPPPSELSLRVQVTQCKPAQDHYLVSWRCGGEGLGGEVARGQFRDERGADTLAPGAWSAPLPLKSIVGDAKSWQFPTLVVGGRGGGNQRRNRRDADTAPQFTDVAVQFEFVRDGKTIASFTETAPRGSTVSFACSPESIQALSTYVHARRERLEKLFAGDDALPKQFAIFGRMGGYGEGWGRGIRHCNPQIAADELRALHLIGVNSLISEQAERIAAAADMDEQFARMYWGRLGGSGKQLPPGVCPFDPPKLSKADAQDVIDSFHHSGMTDGWAQRGDEIGVAAKEHLASCPKCAAAFRKYLQSQRVALADVDAKSWDDVTPYAIWQAQDATTRPRGKKDPPFRPAPQTRADALRYYYTFRFMTYATAPHFADAARQLKEAGLPTFSMLAPTPSWNGHSLDWHEFFDLGANTAIVFETSNTDPQVWQLESYLADIARGIAQRHGGLPMGCLVKPHRGAPAQRLLSVVARGATTIQWYTYGPDYAKGDSFSQSPQLLEAVGKADRFLAKAEDYLYGAHWAVAPQVALVFPRSSEIWEKSRGQIASLEDAKWVYLALAHAHVPVDILSEQQLAEAEGKLDRYKAIYLIGPNLRRDAAARVMDWVRAGGTLWTDAGGMSRDEADQPTAWFDLKDRQLESWGIVPPYRAINLQPLSPTDRTVEIAGRKFAAVVGREVSDSTGWDVLGRFDDDRPALVRRRFDAGTVVSARFWAGLAYSATVRRNDFDMRRDFDPALRALIVSAAIDSGAARPVLPADPLVEAVLLEKDGRKSVAVMNWGYRAGGILEPVEGLKIKLPVDIKSARSIEHGDLRLYGRSAFLPTLDAADVLILE